MTEKTESGVSTLDTVKLVLAAALLIGGVFAYYWYSQASIFVRLGALLAGVGAAIAVGMQSEPGRALWHFMQGSRVELRKVVWPTRQETFRITWVVLAVVVVISLILSLFDLIISFAVKWLLST